MSVNVSAEGTSWNDPATAPAVFTGVTGADFSEGKGEMDSSILKLYVEPLVDIDATTLPVPSVLGACDGAELILVKNNVGGGKITYTDPITGRSITHVNKQDESLTLSADESTDTWVYKH